jgi:FHA domain
MNEHVDEEKTGIATLVQPMQQAPAAVLLPVISEAVAKGIQGHRCLYGCYVGPTSAEILLPAEGRFTIGRKTRVSDLYLEYPDVSRSHAVIECQESMFMLTDLDSLNGTFLNEQRVKTQRPQLLQPGDRLRFGQDADFLFLVPEQAR